jgi:hypothetical protein
MNTIQVSYGLTQGRILTWLPLYQSISHVSTGCLHQQGQDLVDWMYMGHLVGPGILKKDKAVE